jgi:DNA-directed RNA polymerase-3 subunit RPC5
MMDESDPLISVLPIHFSNSLSPNIHIHQYPLLSRPLQAPPSAVLSGKHVRARIKPHVRRLEVHVPADTRPEIWNSERATLLGVAQSGDDRQKNQTTKLNQQGEEPRLTEVRMRSEQITQKGVYVLGIVCDGMQFVSHLHWDIEGRQVNFTFTQ